MLRSQVTTGFAALGAAGEADAGADVTATAAATATAQMGENRIGPSIDSHRDRLNRPPQVWRHP
ncbi:hypothetical protein GCM10023170_064680 [Phytohabitans houttuyneae]|uniref:Uncharacterized protein n=1 Tax=Phytohabitans houttuyneae TaxID=1076126 RepID=A0A6V8KJB3_9ACTN|nr:hypothetical protein Phou_059770 [Phytohabitans houttuyneae]